MSLNFRVAPLLTLLSLLIFSCVGFAGGFSVPDPTPITIYNPITNTGYQGGSTSTASSDSSGGGGSNTEAGSGLYFCCKIKDLTPSLLAEFILVTKDYSLRADFLTKFTKERMIPSISNFVKSTEVKFAAIEDMKGTPVFYTSLYLPGASIAFANGSACRAMFTHTDGKRVFVYTVSMDFEEIGPPGIAFDKIEKTAKTRSSSF